MKSLLGTAGKFFFSDHLQRNRHSNERPKPFPRRQSFHLEPLESRLLLSADLLGAPAIWTDLGPGAITNAANVDLDGNNNPTGTPFRTGDAADIDAGAIEAVAVDPTNPAHVAIGSVNGGVWVTGNINVGPVGWTTHTDQLPSLAISAVAFSPTNGNIIYAGTGSYTNGAVGFQANVANPASVTTAGSGGAAGFVYRSDDGGASWNVLGSSVFAGLRIRDIVPTSLNAGQTVFVGTTDVNGPNTGGVYRSDDSGVTWTRLSGANGLPNQGVTDLIADPNNPNRFFTAVPNGAGAGVYVLDTTIGNNWTNVTGDLPAGALAGQRILLSISTAGAHPIWAGVINNAGFLQGVYRGLEGGGTAAWTAVGPGGLPPDIYGLANPQGATNFSLVADPNQDNFVYVGGDAKTPFPFGGNLARGDSTAQTWTAISRLGTASAQVGVTLPLAGANPATTAPHSDSRNMVFDGNNIIEVNDGGIYLLTNPTGAAAAPTWSSLHGNLQIGEAYQAAIDTLNTAMTTDDVYLDAQQDDGANERSTAGAWQEAAGGDGTIVLTDSVNGHRYFSTQNFSLERRDGGGALVIPAGTINNAGAIAGLTLNGAAAAPQVEVMPFFTVAVLNGSNPNRMLVGGNTTLYESTDNANTFRSIGGLNGAGNGALGIAGLTGVVTAIAYGNTTNANLAYVADQFGNLLMTTNITAAGGGFVATDFNVVAGGNAALGIVVDPNNGNIAYAVTNTGVFRTTNGANWASITDNILQIAQSGGANTLASIALFNNATATTGDDVLLVGGLGGVFRRPVSAAPNPNSNWTEYGEQLPNVVVTSLTYSAQGDTLLASTYGRSNWTLANVTNTISVPGILQIFGDEDFFGEDDTIRLVRDAVNPSLLDVFINADMSQFQLSLIEQINVFGLGGNDTLIVDSTNGLINVGNGIRYDGDGGVDRLQLLQTGGPIRPSDTFSDGPVIGSGLSTIVGGGTAGTQVVFFEDLSPVLDLVPAALLTVNATATDNAIAYTVGSVIGNGLVTIDEHESIEFANKTALTINAGAGQDTISLNNPFTPIGLTGPTGITVNGGDPSSGDTLTVTGVGAAVTVDTATGTITGASGAGGAVPIHYGTVEALNLLADIGDLTITTTGADDTVVVTPGLTTGANSGTVQSSGAVPQIAFVNSGTLTANLAGGSDALMVNGSSLADTVAVSGTAVAITGRRTVNYTGLEALTVNGNAGSDTFNVTPSATVTMFIDGGDPIGAKPGDLLNIIAGGGSVTFNAGPETDEGSFVVGANQPVSFDHIESFGITGGGPAVINGTNGPDAITVIARDASTHPGANGVQDFTVSVNTGPELLFINVASLTINALSGSDQVTLQTPAPNNAVWDVDVTVDGGPPAADTDRLIVQTPGAAAENVVYAPTAADGGTLDLTSLSSVVTIANTEVLSYDGQGDNDSLTVAGTGGDDTIVHNPGVNGQAGSFQVNSLLALSYQNLGNGGSLTANGGGGNDMLVYNGTAANDSFTIGAAGQVNLNSRLVLNTTGVEILTLEGLDGDDTFTLVPAISASVYSTINLNGGGQASATGDRVNLIATAGADNIDISGQVISLGGKIIHSSGIEDIRLDALAGDDLITYNGVSGITENITVSSSGVAGGGQVSVPGVALINFSGVERIDVNGNTPSPSETDTLTFAGTNAADTFNINLAAAATNADPILQLLNGAGTTLLTLRNYTNFDTLRTLGLDGTDTFNVTTAGGGPSRDLFVDGGLPSGKKKSTDNLNVFYTPPRPSIIHSAATQDPDAGIVDLDYGTARFVVQYDDIEQVVIRKK